MAVNVTPNQDNDLSEWRRKGGYTFPIALSTEDFAQTNYAVVSEPTYLLLNSDHRMVARHDGGWSAGEMESEIRETLGLDPFEGIETAKDAAPAAARASDDKLLADVWKRDRKDAIPVVRWFIFGNPDYPRLPTVYGDLLRSLTAEPPDADMLEQAVIVADEALAMFPDNRPLRARAVTAKLGALQGLKRNEAFGQALQKLLDTESDPEILRRAASVDQAHSLQFLDKAIAERRKNASETIAPTVDDLHLEYVQSLDWSGRKVEALKLATDLFEQTTKKIADVKALPKENRDRLRLVGLSETMVGECGALVKLLSDTGDYARAIEYIALTQRIDADEPLASVTWYERQRANVYEKWGKPDLQMDSYARSFAARMDPETADKIRALAAKVGRKPEDVFERSRQIRNQNATPISGFELKTPDGSALSLDSLRARAKATLVNFFHPT